MPRVVAPVEGLAWAAGLFDGDGGISVQLLKSGRASVSMRLNNTDRTVVEAFHEAVSRARGTVREYRQNARRLPYWRWYARQQDVFWIAFSFQRFAVAKRPHITALVQYFRDEVTGAELRRQIRAANHRRFPGSGRVG